MYIHRYLSCSFNERKKETLREVLKILHRYNLIQVLYPMDTDLLMKKRTGVYYFILWNG